jgi:hypothetical protein
MPGRLLAEELQVQLAVLNGTEDSLAIVAALGDVVRRTGNDNPWTARHIEDSGGLW